MDIDPQVTAAITAVAPGDPDAWFAAVRGAYDELAESGGPVDWDAFKTVLAARAQADGVPTTLVDGFVEAMETYDPAPVDTVAKLHELGETLPVLYLEHAAASAGAGPTGAGDDGFDEATWNAFLLEHGPRWNGEESAWEQFKQWFLYEANQKGVAIPANEFVIYAESQADKVATFVQYGVRIAQEGAAAGGAEQAEEPAVNTAAFPAVQEGDSGEWVQYLDEMLKSKGF